MDRLNYNRVLTLLFLASVFLLALTKIRDTDTWTHLSFGRIIWENKGLPAHEPFVYTMKDKPFSYSNWLFGFVYYLVFLLFNVYGVVLLKAVTLITAFYILLKDSLRPYKDHILAISVLTVAAVVCYRWFVERPDTFLMVFLPFSIFSLNAFVYENKKYIYFLPVTHLLWANSHSSINLMAIPFFSFLIGGYMQQRLEERGVRFSNTPSMPQLKTILFVFIVSFAASLLSPYSIHQYTFGIQFLSADWFKQEIQELQAPTWDTWKSPYLITGAVGISFLLNMFVALYSRDKKSNPSIIYLLLFMPFVLLSFTAIRFILLLSIVSMPILVRNLSAVFRFEGNSPYKNVGGFIIAIWIITYTAFAISGTGFFVKYFGNKNIIPGFGINDDTVPEKVLKYMDMKGITGKMFNAFEWGGYITWRDFPKRMVIIDTRGYVPPDLLDKMTTALHNPPVFDKLEETYGFEAAVLNYWDIDSNVPETAAELGFSHPRWALVYWDDTSLLYLKRGGRYDSIIREDEYKYIKPANGVIFSSLQYTDYRLNLVSELKRNAKETESSMAYAFLGSVYNHTGLYREAIDSFSKVRNGYKVNYSLYAYNGMAYAYDKLGYLDQSIKYYEKFLSVNKNAAVFYDLGTVYIKKGNKNSAINCFEKALELDKNLTYVYPLLIGLYQELGKENNMSKLRQMYERAKTESEGERHFKEGMKAYLENKGDLAIGEFNKSIAINPSNPAAYSSIGYVYFDKGMLNEAFAYQKKAIDINPDFAEAHYGIALVYKGLGDLKTARMHFGEYLRIQPKGYYYRRAKEEIADIDSRLKD